MLVLLAVKRFHMMWANYYMAGIAPGIALLAAQGAIGIVERLSTKVATRVGAVTFGVGLCLLAGALAWWPVQMHENWRGAAQVVASEARPGDGIVFLGDPAHSPIESRAPFEAAWREVPHGASPTPVSPARPFGRVQRIDKYLTPAQLRAAVTKYQRVWIVDYKGFDELHRVLESPPFTSVFERTSSQTFPGDITLTLFTRRAP